MRSACSSAHAAYYSSRAVTWERCEAIYPAYARLMDDPVRQSESQINVLVKQECQVSGLPCEDKAPNQQRVAHALASARTIALKERAGHFDRARLTAYSAPMAGRWLLATPAKTLDMHMSGVEVAIASSLHLGVDVMKGGGPCRFCGAVLDGKGVHCASCMAGGDVSLRHNRVRNIVYRYSCRAQLNAELEKAGVLDEDGVFIDLSRPADVMVDEMDGLSRGSERLALDVKVINALGSGHYQDTLEGPLVAAEKYRETACARGDVRARCAAKGVRYEPLVFTTQGGCEKHAEAILSKIADKVSQVESRDAGKIKAEFLEAICMSIAKSVAKAVMRRRPRAQAQGLVQSEGFLAELAILDEPVDG